MKRILSDYEKLIDEKLSLIQFILCVEFQKPEYLIRAFTGVEFAKVYNDVASEIILDHDTLATFGDACLKLLIMEYLFAESASLSKGEISKRAEEYIRDISLDQLELWNKIKSFVLVHNNDSTDKKLPNTTIEAIVGAVYLSNGLNDARDFIARHSIYTK